MAAVAMRYEARFTPTVEDDVTAHRMRNRQSDDVFTLCAIAAALFDFPRQELKALLAHQLK